MKAIPNNLAPIVYDDSEILILGSFPGIASLKAQQYYAKPGNRFWPMIARIYGEATPTPEQRDDFLKRNKIALWDVYESVVREGSSDAKIEKSVPNNIADFLDKHKTIKKILVAGKKAQQGFEEHNKGIIYIPVPSTSGANAHFDESKWCEAIEKEKKL